MFNELVPKTRVSNPVPGWAFSLETDNKRKPELSVLG